MALERALLFFEVDAVDAVVGAFVQDEVSAVAAWQDILDQIVVVHGTPNGIGDVNCILKRQLGVTVEVAVGVIEGALAQL